MGGTSVTAEMSEILGWVCFDLELWKRELSAAQCQIDGKDEEGNLSQITSLQKCLSGCAVSQQRPHAGRQDTVPACTGGFGLVPKEHLRRMRRGAQHTGVLL